MKKVFSIIISSILVLCMIACGGQFLSNSDKNPMTNGVTDKAVESAPKSANDPVTEPDPTEEPTPEPTEAPTPTPEPTPEPIDYENLFDFSGWEEAFDEAMNKEDFIKEYWKDVSSHVFMDNNMYNLLKSDPLAKEAFLREFKEEMMTQMIRYLEYMNITVDDSIHQMIEQTIDDELEDLANAIHD